MIPEIGHFALIVALCVAIVQTTLPIAGTIRGVSQWTAMAIPAARLQMVFMLIAFVCLAYAFVTHDYSVAYVAQNSNNAQPLMYRISAVWGAHEGSLLLWALLLSIWGVAISLFSRSVPAEFTARVLAVLGFISIGFMLFMMTTSNPFERLLPAPLDGRELNPLLQDPGLAIHPPMLYTGYVGLVVPFAFAIAALLDGRLDAAWVRWARPWTIVAWIFLTLGIALGSWWAYYELGWGGWWFWDPVENASFMPWLVATGLLHSLAVTEKRGAFKSWTVLLSIFAFTLSLLGTFLVRSGVLVSVHAFASDPARGVFILGFLGVVIGSSLLLFAWRSTAFSGGGSFSLLSRDNLLLVNNVLLTVASASVLIGTLYPLFLDALNLGKISVGPPYFDSVFVPLILPVLFLLGVGPLTRWKRDRVGHLVRKLRLTFVLSLVFAIALIAGAGAEMRVMVLVGLFMSVWIMASSVQGVMERVRAKQGLLAGLRGLPRAFLGMTLAHVGVAVVVVGVTLSKAYSLEEDLRMAPGDSFQLSDYTYHFEGTHQVPGANYTAQQGTVTVTRNGEQVALLHPQKRYYSSMGNPMTEASINSGFTRDLYVALGEPLEDGAWSVRFYYKPFIQWLWIGPLLMALGGLLAATDRRYRLAARVRKQAREDRSVSGPLAEGRA